MRLLITAGPTHEPIDAVRYIGNRSSGRLGAALAMEANAREWPTTLLLGPSSLEPLGTHLRLDRFRTATDLQRLLEASVEACDALIMAAAVADYRPVETADERGKIRRKGEEMVLRLAPTPDLLASLAPRKRADQTFVGFALEPRAELMRRAREKLQRKSLDAIVANPLETMDSGEIEATLLTPDGILDQTRGLIDKQTFAPWLLDRVADLHERGVRD